MTTLREIRNRLRAVQQIKQITNAMEMVAGARIRRAQAKANQSKPYMVKTQELVEILSLAAGKDFTHPLFEQRQVKNTCVLIVTADRGLSGAYNANVFAQANSFLSGYHQPNTLEIIPIGRKAVDYYRHKKWRIRHEVSEWGGKITIQQIRWLTHELINRFIQKEFDEVWIVYTSFIHLLARKVVVEKFLNIESFKTEPKQVTLDYIFEPNVDQIFSELLPRYCIAKMQSVFNQAYLSELSARIVSMKTATTNAEEMIEQLTLVRNKVRQASITKEMLEMTSNA
jgi:F-type H+-transporting ATPase subunit gamma